MLDWGPPRLYYFDVDDTYLLYEILNLVFIIEPQILNLLKEPRFDGGEFNLKYEQEVQLNIYW